MANIEAMLTCVLVSGSLSAVVFVVGFIAPYWTWYKVQGMDTHTGLWQWCRLSTIDHKEMCGDLASDDTWPGWLKVSQGLLSTSLLCSILALISATVWAFRGPRRPTCIATCVFFILSALLALFGSCIYGVKMGEHLSWAFAFDMACALLFVIPAILSAIVAHLLPNSQVEKL